MGQAQTAFYAVVGLPLYLIGEIQVIQIIRIGI